MNEQTKSRFYMNIFFCIIFSFAFFGCNSEVKFKRISDYYEKYFEDPETQNDFGGSGAPIDWDLPENLLLFQDNYSDSSPNKGGTVARNSVADPDTIMVFADPNDNNKLKLLLTEWTNSRVLLFNKIPESNSALPDLVIGQPNFTTAGVNSTGVNAASLNRINSATVCKTGELILADRLNNRILIYKKIPKTDGASADYVIGQVDFSSNLSNQGLASPTASTISSPQGVSCKDDKLYVADSGNNRILVFNEIPSSNNASADLVFGQPDFVTNTFGCTQTGFRAPHSMSFYNNQMIVIDQTNNRILTYSTIPSTNNPAATSVIGQDDFVTCGINKGAGSLTPSQGSLWNPQSISINSSGLLAIADRKNNRVLFYDLPHTQGDEAIGLLGQPDYLTNTVAAPSSTNFEQPIGLIFHGNKIWVVDQKRHRFLTLDLPNNL